MRVHRNSGPEVRCDPKEWLRSRFVLLKPKKFRLDYVLAYHIGYLPMASSLAMNGCIKSFWKPPPAPSILVRAAGNGEEFDVKFWNEWGEREKNHEHSTPWPNTEKYSNHMSVDCLFE